MRILRTAWRPNKWLTALLASALASTALMGLPLSAAAHQIAGSVNVDCHNGTVSVSVTNWSGNVEITRTSPVPVKVTRKMPSASNSTVVFSLDEIGGNGSYTAGRQGNPNDPTPVKFTVACSPTFTLTKTVAEGDGATVPINSVLHYTVTLHNSSTYRGNAPTITDTITGSAPYSVVGGPTASQGTITGSASPWTWAPGSLAGGANATVTLNVRITGDGTIVNTAANGNDAHAVRNNGHTPAGTLSGDIQRCDGTHVNGGTIAATGPTNVPAQNNQMSASVAPGTYAEQATSPAHFHFVRCNGFSGSGSRATIAGIKVPDGGSGTATFYIAANNGTLTGDIKLCDGTHVDGGTIAGTGPTNVAAQNNSMSASVAPGTYAEQATSPAHYHFVSCHGFEGSGAGATVSGINVPSDGSGNATFYIAQNPGSLTGVILFCNADGTVGTAASGTITIPGTSAAPGAAAPVTVTTAAGTYAITAGNAPSGNRFVNCGAGGGSVSGDKGSAGQSGVVTPDNNTTVTFYVQAIPAGSVLGTSTGGTQAGGVLGAATTQPNTGGTDLAKSLMIAVAMMMLGFALIVRQAFYGPTDDR